VAKEGKRLAYWQFQGRLFTTADLRLTAEDVAALALERENQRRLRLEKAHALQAMQSRLDQQGKRERIPQCRLRPDSLSSVTLAPWLRFRPSSLEQPVGTS
jgi:hypothetical protein